MASCVSPAGQLWAWERRGLMPPAGRLGLRHGLEGLRSWRQQLPTARQLWALHWMLPSQPAGSRQDPVIGCTAFLAVSDPSAGFGAGPGEHVPSSIPGWRAA